MKHDESLSEAGRGESASGDAGRADAGRHGRPARPGAVVRVLVAEDSQATRLLLVHMLESDPRIRVIGTVGDGQAAVDFVTTNRPDVVLMDIYMPRMDGFEATRRIMETAPVPIVICSAVSKPDEVVTTFRSMEAGAVACIEKPAALGSPDFAALSANLLQTVHLMSEVRVVRRWPRVAQPPSAERAPLATTRAAGPVRIIGIGTSTGGPPVLQTILGGLPEDFPVPILIVQHIAQGFLPGLADWLNHTTGLQVRIASLGTVPLPHHVYLAPDDFHMGLGDDGAILLTRGAPENGLRPAVSSLFRSLARVCGPNAVGVLLTGMGADGAAELKLMKERGATTIAQDRESSVVYGMPGAAAAQGAASHILPADGIASALLALVRRWPSMENHHEQR